MSILIIIIALPMCLCHNCPYMRYKIAEKRADYLNYHLSENFFPEHYTLKIFPQFNNRTFVGYVKILIHFKVPTSNITLHQKDLNITKEKIYLTTEDDTVINIKDAGDSGTKEQEFYTITFHNILNEKTYYLHIPEFYGVINNLNRGFYYAQYTDKNGTLFKFALTKFESTSARYAFPCFDEPSFRAKFKIYIIRPSNYNSLSNTKLIKSQNLNNKLYEDEFETSVSMPTYLVAYIVSEMKSSTIQGAKFYRIFARPEAIRNNYDQYSLNISDKILRGLETYFDVKYSLNKMDQVAIPIEYYTSGATENWGLVMYKESGLLFTPETTTATHNYIDTVKTHEFSHQWFGNLVTIKWWRYLWLKEGFAKFFESKILDQVKPEWRMMEQFIVKIKETALENDASIKTRDMNQDAGTPEEISALYDIIAYRKGAAVIYMLEVIMTPNIFKNGITNFLRDRSFQSATPTDLYRNFQKAMDNSTRKLPNNLSIEKVMTTWDSQKGYPLVNVTRDYDKNQDIVKLTQSRYILSTDCSSNSTIPTIWYIPLNYATKSNPDFNDTQCSDWLLKPNAEITVKNLNRDDWLILNKQEAFYYRVNYDAKNWELITTALFTNYSDIHILNRVQIIQDSFGLAKMELLDYSVPLKISEYLAQDDDYITQYSFLRKASYIATLIRGTDVEQLFDKYIVQILKRSFGRLGNKPKANDTLIDKLHRVQIVKWMCICNYPGCREHARKTYKRWRNRKESLSVDLEEVITCNAIRKGSRNDWNDLFGMYHFVKSEDLKMNTLKLLACTEDVVLLEGFLNSSLNASNTYTLPDVVSLISKKGLVGLQVSMRYVTVHFDSLQSRFGDKNMVILLNKITTYFRSEAQFAQFTAPIRLKNSTAKTKVLQLSYKIFRSKVTRIEKSIYQISKFFRMEFRSNGCNLFPHLFSFTLYSLIAVTILCL